MTGAIRGPIAITHLRSAGSRKACRVRGGAEGFIGGILEKKVAPVGAREGFDYLMGLRDLVREETACSLPGVFIKFEVFMPLLRKAQSQGYVRDADAILWRVGSAVVLMWVWNAPASKASESFATTRRQWPHGRKSPSQ